MARLKNAFILGIAASLLALMHPLLANPQITGVTQSAQGLVNGSTLVISGSGFGTKMPAAPYLWADFAQGTLLPSDYGIDPIWWNYQLDNYNSSVAPSGSIGNLFYNSTGGPENGPFANGYPQNGSGVSWAFFIVPPMYNTSSGKYGFTWNRSSKMKFTWNDLGGRYFISRKMRKNFVTSQIINWKPFRTGAGGTGGVEWVWGAWNGDYEADGFPSNGIPNGYPTNGMSNAYAATYLNGSSIGTQTNTTFLEGPISKWFTDEIVYQTNSCYKCADGNVQWIVNGSLEAQQPINMGWTLWSLTLRENASEDMRWIGIQGVADNDASFPKTNTFGVADIYVDNTWSRVMICAASTWSACKTNEVEIPTAWSQNSITVVLRAGAIINLNNAYLYVVDSNGDVNQNGYPL